MNVTCDALLLLYFIEQDEMDISNSSLEFRKTHFNLADGSMEIDMEMYIVKYEDIYAQCMAMYVI